MNHASTPTLRPRDIQARIRSGESPESVADAAGTTVERIMPFAAPVIAEREHIAERALKASVRRRPADTTTGATGVARTLGDAVVGHLRGLDVDAETVEWDSWRRSDGRWSLVALYTTAQRSGTAELTFDPPGNFVSLDNDDARWLVGDVLVEPEPERPRDDLAQARERRLAPVPPAPPVTTPVEEPVEDLLTMDEPLEAFLPDSPAVTSEPEQAEEPAATHAVTEPDRAETPAVEPQTVAEEQPAPAPQPPARRTPTKKRGRASVPSWDEIMFGGGSSD